MIVDPAERRRHPRHKVNEPCTAHFEDGTYIGSVVNMSVSSAAIILDIEIDADIKPDTIIELDIPRIGMIRTRVVRPLIGGIAVEFLFNPEQDRQLIAQLWKVLNEYAPSANLSC